MAYALIAELPTQIGLYTAVIGAIVGALWGSSQHLQTGPTNAASLLVLSILLPVAVSGSPEYIAAAGLLTLLVGFFRLAMGLARLGMLVNFVSDSVITGFTAGAGLLIFFNQLRHLLGLSIPASERLWHTLQLLAQNLTRVHALSLALGLGVALAILLLKRLLPRFPGPMLALLGASLLSGIFHLEGRGVNIIGAIPNTLPPLSIPPLWNLELVSKVTFGALSVAAIGLVEAISIARGIASQSGQRIDSNQEFVGQGLANIVSSLFSGYTCSGSFTRTAVNYQAGAKTGLSNVFAGLFVLAAFLLFGRWAAFIPLPALAGLVVVVALQLIDRKEIGRIWKGASGDRAIMLVTFGATLLLPLQYAVLTGILMSLAYYLIKTSTPQVRWVQPDENFEVLASDRGRQQCPQLAIVEIMGDLYFGAVQHIENQLRTHLESHPGQRYLLLRMYSVEHCDMSGIHALESILRHYRQAGGDVFLSRVQPAVMEIMRSTGFVERLGRERFLGRGNTSIQHLFYHVLDPAICVYECPVRAFQECQNLAKRLDLVGDAVHTQAPDQPIPMVSPQELWQAMHLSAAPEQLRPVVIDVREPREFQRGHIPGARLLPLPQILRDPSLLANEKKIVFICQGGRRSQRAAARMLAAGHPDVRTLAGGMNAWEAANLLVASGEEHERNSSSA